MDRLRRSPRWKNSTQNVHVHAVHDTSHTNVDLFSHDELPIPIRFPVPDFLGPNQALAALDPHRRGLSRGVSLVISSMVGLSF